jgi:hypothetical protein
MLYVPIYLKDIPANASLNSSIWIAFILAVNVHLAQLQSLMNVIWN